MAPVLLFYDCYDTIWYTMCSNGYHGGLAFNGKRLMAGFILMVFTHSLVARLPKEGGYSKIRYV